MGRAFSVPLTGSSKGVVVDRGLAQVFGIGLTFGLTRSGTVRGAIIFEDERMVHGNIAARCSKSLTGWPQMNIASAGR